MRSRGLGGPTEIDRNCDSSPITIAGFSIDVCNAICLIGAGSLVVLTNGVKNTQILVRLRETDRHAASFVAMDGCHVDSFDAALPARHGCVFAVAVSTRLIKYYIF